jgi:hypothetical protein
MPQGRIPFKDVAEIAVLDVVATDANMNPLMREPFKTPGSDDEGREEDPVFPVPCGPEYDRSELQRMTRQGNVPDGAIGLMVHMRDMRRGDGTTSYVKADGSLIFLNGRLVRTLDKTGVVIETFDGNPKPKVYCTEIHPLQSSLGRRGPNLHLLLFTERPTGLV